jgi:hypothetical protein
MLGAMLARRLLLLAAVLMLLTALAAGLAPQRSGTRDEPPAAATGDLPAGSTVVKTIPAEPGSDSRVVVHRGDTLELEVTGDTPDSVLIERLDRLESIDPDSPARFELLIDAPAGAYPIRLVDADRQIGLIDVLP